MATTVEMKSSSSTRRPSPYSPRWSTVPLRRDSSGIDNRYLLLCKIDIDFLRKVAAVLRLDPSLQDTYPKEQSRELWRQRGGHGCGDCGQHGDGGGHRRRRHKVGPRGRPPLELPARLASLHGHP